MTAGCHWSGCRKDWDELELPLLLGPGQVASSQISPSVMGLSLQLVRQV